MIDHNYHYRDESSENDVLCKDTNDTKNRHSSNSNSAHSNDIDKTNVERKSAKTKKEIHNPLLHSKKQKCSNEIPNNKNTNVLRTTTIKNVKRKKKQQCITLDYKTKIRRTNRAVKQFAKCDICFREFVSVRNCEFHKQHYEFAEDNNCKICKKNCITRDKLHRHIYRVHSMRMSSYRYSCNFCSRTFKTKSLLQSHLFHVHSELIYCTVNISLENNTSKANANEESCLSNFIKPEKRNTTLMNNANKSLDDNVDSEKSRIEKSFSNEMSTKRLRQPTLTEYLELRQKKHDIKLSPNKLNIMTNDLSTCALHHGGQIEGNSKLSEGHNGQIESLPTTLDNLSKQIARSIPEQSVKHEIRSKKPFVRLHADVEMMKSFLAKLSDTVIEDKVIKKRTSDIVSCDREIPYSLRSLRVISSVEADSNSEINKSKNVSKKSRSNIEFSTKREQNMIDLDKVNSKIDWKIIMAHKYKECTISLTRCDERPKNFFQISTIEAMRDTSLTTQCNSTLVQESDIRDKMMLKDLEVSLERLTAVPTIDINAQTTSDIEKHNNNLFLCKVCKQSFSSKLAKRIHIKSSHIAYMSSICNARYTLKHKLLEHYLHEHLFKQDQCCICYMLLPDYETLKQHLNIHCLKYIQRENDRCPIDIELKCNLIKRTWKCLHCNKIFSSQSSLVTHQSCCTEEMEEAQKDFMKEASTYPKYNLTMQHKNTDENIVTHDERINLDNLCKPSINSDCVKESNECQILLSREKESKINEANQNSFVNNNLLTEKKIEMVNKSQDSKKLSENNIFTISNQNITNAQLDDITIRTTTYPCDICGKQFHNSKNLEVHIRSFSFTTNICPMCGTGFSSKRLLQTHITAAHVPQISKTYNFHCMFCNQGFFKKHDLRPHILHLHGQQMLNMLAHNLNVIQEKSDKSIIHTAICNVCNLVFETHDRYIEHRMYYYKNHTFTCSLCAQNFQGMYMFHHHNKLTHYSEDKRKSYNYICDICNEGFNHESHFHSHNMHVHSNEINLVDAAKESEEKSFDYSSDVQKQNRNFSTDQQKQNEESSNEYICQICQLKCTDLNHIEKHKEFYSNDGDFRCDKCNRRCKTFYLLDQHRKLTHSCHDVYNEYLCHICGEVLETVVALKCHEKHFHSNITDNNVDNWENCNQTSSSNITYKTMEHSDGSKNNTCDITAYNCLFCNMKFSTANSVQTHIVYVHMDDMIAKRAALKLTLPIIDSNNMQKQFVETDQISSLSSSSSEDNLTQLLRRSTIQQPNNISNTMTKNEMNDRTTIKLLKKFNNVRPKNNKLEKTPVPAIPYINKSKDNILTCSTIASNTESKINSSISLSTGSTTFRTVAPTENNTSALLSTRSTIFKTIASNTVSKDNTSILLSKSTNDLRKSYGGPLKSDSINEFKTNSSSSTNKAIIIDKSKTAPVPLLSTGSLSILKGAMPQSWKSNEITNQKSESVNSYSHGYSCPLCPLEYPSLMFFQAHLKYAHANSIRTNQLTIPQMNQAQKASMIECLLCPRIFTDEIKYKKHLRNYHTYYVYIPNSEEMTKINNVCNPVRTQTNINRRNTIPETITVDDDNSSDQQAAQVAATLDHRKSNEKIGKLRVKPFAKIIENLSTDSASKFL